MTHRVTLDVPVTGTNYGMPYVSSIDADGTVAITNDGASRVTWSGVQIDHTPEPGTSGTATMGVYKQSDNALIAQVNTTGTIYLYYPNNAEYANANLLSNQGICEWDTYYYINVAPNNPSQRRENIAIRKITTTTTP
jgi:hypothetical protein